MPIGIDDLRVLLESEIAHIDDPAFQTRVQCALTEPRLIECGWDYGAPDEILPCWVAAEDRVSVIVHCDRGFGPQSPWGLIWLPESESDPPPRMGQDSGWFPTFREACENWLPLA